MARVAGATGVVGSRSSVVRRDAGSIARVENGRITGAPGAMSNNPSCPGSRDNLRDSHAITA